MATSLSIEPVPFPEVKGVEFRLVEGFPAYCVGTDGSCWSRWNLGNHTIDTKWKRRKGLRLTSGYLQMTLCNSPGQPPRRVYIHSLILETFVGPRPDGMECCHGDGNPANNALPNLRWDSPKANADDRFRHDRHNRGSRNGSARLTEADVRTIKTELQKGVSQADLARLFKVDQSTISNIATGKRWGWLTD